MKRTMKLLWALVLVGMLAFGAGCKKSEEKLAGHTESMAKIMESNIESPKDGVEELRDYLRSNLPEMMELAGDMIVELDEIEDGAERAKRAKEMLEVLQKAAKESQETGMKFAGAVMKDKDSQKLLEEIGSSYEKMFDEMKSGGLMDMLKGF